MGDEFCVDELAAIVAVIRADHERQAFLGQGLDPGEIAVRVVPGGRVLDPSSREVKRGQGTTELTL